MEKWGFGKKEATQLWSKMPSPLDSSHQGLVHAQMWGPELEFCCDPLAQSPYLLKGACLRFQSSVFLPHVLPFPDQILIANSLPQGA